MSLADEPAFPGVRGESGYGDSARVCHPDGSVIFVDHNQGLTLRQYYAGRAMQGLLSNLSDIRREGFKDSDIPLFAVMQADALLAELSRGKEGE